jgi:hypothetical protein
MRVHCRVFAPENERFIGKPAGERSFVGGCNALSPCNRQRTATKLQRKLFIS